LARPKSACGLSSRNRSWLMWNFSVISDASLVYERPAIRRSARCERHRRSSSRRRGGRERSWLEITAAARTAWMVYARAAQHCPPAKWLGPKASALVPARHGALLSSATVRTAKASIFRRQWRGSFCDRAGRLHYLSPMLPAGLEFGTFSHFASFKESSCPNQLTRARRERSETPQR
jgi:hypothetical protein